VHEPRRLSLAAVGLVPKSHTGAGRRLDFFDLKGAIDDILERLGIAGARYESAAIGRLHPASAASISLPGSLPGSAGGTVVGTLGQLHPLVAKAFDVPADTFVAELDWEVLLSHVQLLRKSHGVPKFPGIARDLAFVVDDAVPAARMESEIRAADAGRLLERLALFDVFKGPPDKWPQDKKSMAYSLSLRAPDRTLTDAEADALVAAIKERLKSALGAEIRG
jgi:phenylalanyl-tRNA synthetase beta chain